MTMDDERQTIPTTDTAIASMFDRRARGADGSELRDSILQATRALPQARRWRIGHPAVSRARVGRVLLFALVATALGVLVVVGSGALRRDQAPKETAVWFVRPFEYSIPAGSALRPAVDGPHRDVAAWVEGPDLPPQPSAETLYGGQLPGSGNLRGIIVASGEHAWSHSGTGRFFLRTAPAEFIADLRDTAAVAMDPIVRTALDGRAALTTVLRGGGTDIHLGDPITGLTARGFVLISLPTRLTVSEIDETTVFILVWARTSDDLVRWMPVADQFVASIDFLPESN